MAKSLCGKNKGCFVFKQINIAALLIAGFLGGIGFSKMTPSSSMEGTTESNEIENIACQILTESSDTTTARLEVLSAKIDMLSELISRHIEEKNHNFANYSKLENSDSSRSSDYSIGIIPNIASATGIKQTSTASENSIYTENYLIGLYSEHIEKHFGSSDYKKLLMQYSGTINQLDEEGRLEDVILDYLNSTKKTNEKTEEYTIEDAYDFVASIPDLESLTLTDIDADEYYRIANNLPQDEKEQLEKMIIEKIQY